MIRNGGHPAKDGESAGLDGQRIESADIRKRVIRYLCQHSLQRRSSLGDKGSRTASLISASGVCRFAVLLAAERMGLILS
ncbi:MAG TPA: hypothetical protein VK895_08965 [Jiangellaceae bacterium]|nr:hypothetical protein [Jiangellaceae bacterium]